MSRTNRIKLMFAALMLALSLLACGGGEVAKDGVREHIVINGVPVICSQDGMTGVCPNAIRTVNGNR